MFGRVREASRIDADSDPTPALEEVEARVRELCRSGELPEPDRVIDHSEGEYVALWEESRVALIVEVEREEL